MHNPVDWYAWGDEALKRAEAESRPILLSVGYSACHWCHVMERECFENEAIAKLMNEHFVCIKVDREERPDVDHLYQMVVQLMGRSGGWPLTVFLMPDRKPFFGGTYFPPADRGGMMGFPTVLKAVHEAYTTRRDDVESSAAELTSHISTLMAAKSDAIDVLPDFLVDVAAKLSRRVDHVHGGFGGHPKFPNSMNLDVLLRAAHHHSDSTARDVVFQALDAMRGGGIYDQLGGGFHRYSVDEKWLIPHFEKMLYDNALLAHVYLEAWRMSGEARYRDTVIDTLEYVQREMWNGAFFATQDADSEGEEGKFFAWTEAQIREVVGESDTKVICSVFGVEDEGNFEHGTSVLHIRRSIDEAATHVGVSREILTQALERAMPALFKSRELRPKPMRDEKIIASWNGLMISAFARSGAAFGSVSGAEERQSWVQLAEAALDKLKSELVVNGALAHVHTGGVAKFSAFLDDYANLAVAAMDVFEATFNERHIAFAKSLVDEALSLFSNDDGGFYFAQKGAADLIVPISDVYDNATPSGTSSMCHALLRLASFTGDERYAERAERTIKKLAAQALQNPFGFGHLIGAMDTYVHGTTDIVIVGEKGSADVDALLRVVRNTYVPNACVMLVAPGTTAMGSPAVPRTQKTPGIATVYVCRGRTCGAPVTSAPELRELLQAST